MIRPLNITILGGTGFVGHHLCARLAKEGHRIKVLSRHPERYRDLLVLPTLSLHQANIQDERTLVAHFRDTQVVINLVGILNEKGHHGRGFEYAHVLLSRKIVKACEQTGVQHLLHMSACGASKQAPSFYLKSKGEAEALVHEHNKALLHVTSFRPSLIFGPGNNFFTRFATLLKWSPGFFFLPCPNAIYAPVSVYDVVEVMAQSLLNPKAFNQHLCLCGPTVYSLKALVELIAETSLYPRHIISLPDFFSHIFARISEYIPGKPFSWDNYLSTQIPNVCQTPFPQGFGVDSPTPLADVLPTILGQYNETI